MNLKTAPTQVRAGSIFCICGVIIKVVGASLSERTVSSLEQRDSANDVSTLMLRSSGTVSENTCARFPSPKDSFVVAGKVASGLQSLKTLRLRMY